MTTMNGRLALVEKADAVDGFLGRRDVGFASAKLCLIEQIIDDDSTRQQFIFNQPAAAHAAFLQHIARFETKGFIENKGV